MKRKALSFLLVFTIVLGILSPMAAAFNVTTGWETEFPQETLESPVGDDFNSNDLPPENSNEETETELSSSDSIAPLSTVDYSYSYDKCIHSLSNFCRTGVPTRLSVF